MRYSCVNNSQKGVNYMITQEYTVLSFVEILVSGDDFQGITDDEINLWEQFNEDNAELQGHWTTTDSFYGVCEIMEGDCCTLNWNDLTPLE